MDRRQACVLLASAPAATAFQSELPSAPERPWIGPEFWSNPLQDWRLRNGRIECATAGGDRNVYLLTHEIKQEQGSLHMSVRLGRLEEDTQPLGDGFAGFRVGIHGHFRDYRDSALYGIGLNTGISTDGRLFIGKLGEATTRITQSLDDLVLSLDAKPAGASYELKLSAYNQAGALLGELVKTIPAQWLTGGVALVCSSRPIPDTPDESLAPLTMQGINKPGTSRGGTLRCWFRDWKVSGDKVAVHPERAFGPILFAMHTLSRRVMKLTVQIAPLGPPYASVEFETRSSRGWRRVATTEIDPLSRTATFRIANWNDAGDTPYRVVYHMDRVHHLEGTIRKDPAAKSEIVIAGLSCVNDLGFPHSDVVRNLRHFNPDLIAFTGDQIYERVAGYGIERTPLDRATLDYLRKWYVFGWSFRDLLRDTPCVCLPDDHDVYHGNVWGAGGRRAEGTGQGGCGQRRLSSTGHLGEYGAAYPDQSHARSL